MRRLIGACLCACIGAGVIITLLGMLFYAVSLRPDNVHQVLNDMVISNVTLQADSNGHQVLSANIAMDIYSRNANKNLAVQLDLGKVSLYYRGILIGVGFLPPLFHAPRDVQLLPSNTIIDVNGFRLPKSMSATVISDLQSGLLPLSLHVKVHGHFRPSSSLQHAAVNFAEMSIRGHEWCNRLLVRIDSGAPTSSNHIVGRMCGWTIKGHF